MPSIKTEEVQVTSGDLRLPGQLTIPRGAVGAVIFAHGSGSSRLSPRNLHVAEVLNRSRLATLLFDLLTEDEAEDRSNVFDILLLTERLVGAANWLETRGLGLPLGLFGASTGAAAALMAAAELGPRIQAVVSRGGRPDLARTRLKEVRASTLLIVGGYDDAVIELNRECIPLLRHGELVIIPRATHLFEEPGALDEVASYATRWFLAHLHPTRAAA